MPVSSWSKDEPWNSLYILKCCKVKVKYGFKVGRGGGGTGGGGGRQKKKIFNPHPEQLGHTQTTNQPIEQ